MQLRNLKTSEIFEAEIVEVEESDYKLIKKSKQFVFDWSKEKGNHVLKIVRSGEEENQVIHGLISIKNIVEELRIHINLIESSDDNKTPNKKVERVAGCLLAFAIQVSFENGYFGFTSLVPKTKLIKLYCTKYGFSQFGRQLAIEGKEAIKIIQEYL